jgi:UDP-N-acetylmuramoyl-L-alanyl-D-glutamate--2,6-diaminopimelate ligase
MQMMTHHLEEYIDALIQAELLFENHGASALLHKDVELVTYDSRKAGPGTLYFCKGIHFELKYLEESLSKGAIAYVSEKPELPDSLGQHPCLIVSDIRKAMAIAANLYFNQAWKNFTLIGITGSKGKSTTAFFTRDILDDYLMNQHQPPCAILSSIENFDGIVKEDESLNTTKEAFPLHQHFYNASESGTKYMVTEVSSQGLKYHRTLGVLYDVGVYMNIGRDHISPAEHSDMEDYISSKELLFRQCKVACIHMDTPYSERFLKVANESETIEKIITFGIEPGSDIQGYDIRTSMEGITFRATGPDFDDEFTIGLTGLFNVVNALAAIAICQHLEIPMEFIKSGLYRSRVSGRMELFFNDTHTKTVLMDYAHTYDSMTLMLQSTKIEHPGKKITIVFGCPGNKAESRRKDLPEAAAPYVDKMFITMEDPGEESVEDICNEIAKYAAQAGANYEIILDRVMAIEQAIYEADENTIVIVAAKGWETRHRIGNEYIKTVSDGEVIVETLKKYKTI